GQHARITGEMLDANVVDGARGLGPLVGARSEGGKVVGADHGSTLFSQRVNIELVRKAKGPPFPKRIAQGIAHDQVAVMLLFRVRARVAAILDPRRLANRD